MMSTPMAGACLQLALHFEQHAHSAGAVVRAQDRLVVVCLVGVVVCPRTGVPVCAEQYAPLGIGVERADDVACLERLAVIARQVGTLVVDLRAEGLQPCGQVVTAEVVRPAVRCARTEVHLLLDVEVGTVGIEGRHLHRLLRRLPFGSRCFLAVGTREASQCHRGADEHHVVAYLHNDVFD